MKLIANENIPSRRAIKERFSNRMGGTAKLFEPLAELLSEEAEKIINETWLMPQSEKEEPSITLVRKPKSARRFGRYYCKSCDTQKIYNSHFFCPHCGIAIKWVELKEQQRKIA
jgi:hypothetical protein